MHDISAAPAQMAAVCATVASAPSAISGEIRATPAVSSSTPSIQPQANRHGKAAGKFMPGWATVEAAG